MNPNPAVVGDSGIVRFTGTNTSTAAATMEISTSSTYATIAATRTVNASSSADLNYVFSGATQNSTLTLYVRLRRSATIDSNLSYNISIGANPSNASATSNSSSNVVVSWTSAGGTVTNYGVYWNTINSTPALGATPDFTSTSTSVTDTTIAQGATRHYWVNAKLTTTGSATAQTIYTPWTYAGTGTRLAPTPIPTAPTSLTASKSGDIYIDLSWSGATGTITSYGIWYSPSISGTPTSSSTPDFTTTNTTYRDNNLGFGFGAGQVRYYWVRASNSTGNSAWYPTTNGIKGSTLFTLSFDANYSGATVIPNVTYQSDASTVTLPGAPSRANYSFNGWYTASSGGTFAGGAYASYSAPTTSGTTLYAQWTAFPVSQNYSPLLSGTAVTGTVLTASPGSYNYASTVTTTIAYSNNGTFANAMPSRSSPYTVTDTDAKYIPYYFAAMDTVVGTNGTTYYFYNGSLISKLKVTFNSQSGTTVEPISFIAASPANSITLPYTSRDSYTFNGWYTASTGGTRVGGVYDTYTPSTSASSTLYAQWTLTPIIQNYAPTISGSGISGTDIVTYQGNYSNGTVIGSTPLITYNTTGIFTSGTTTPPRQEYYISPHTVTDFDATNPAYYFAAYDAVQNGVGTIYYYYSTSIKAGFQITYVYQNGLGNTSEIFYSAVTNPTLTLPSPTKNGYTISGWYDSNTDGTKVGNAGGPYTPQNSNKTLYAQWVANDYTLTYDANGGIVSPASIVIKYDSQYGELPTPSRTGYNFLGWYTDPTDGTQVLSTDTYATADDSTIYARWQGVSYVVSLYPNYPIGGTSDPVYSTKNVYYDSEYGQLPVLTRTGYIFNGWYTSVSSGVEIFSTTLYSFSEDTNLYAQWTASTPVFSDETITTTAYLNKDVSTSVDHIVVATPANTYSIIYSGTGLDPTSWLTITKEPGSNDGVLAGKPTQIGVYTFVVRATADGGYTDSGLFTMTVFPVGKRSIGYAMTSLTVAKRFNGSTWVDMKIMKRFDGSSWKDISNI